MTMPLHFLGSRQSTEDIKLALCDSFCLFGSVSMFLATRSDTLFILVWQVGKTNLTSVYGINKLTLLDSVESR